MSHKPGKTLDYKIGVRAFEEILRLTSNLSIAEFCRKNGLCKTAIYRWSAGSFLPSADCLQALYRAGADIDYILSGERSY